MSKPKTLAERLEWMAANLPGFREEMDAVLALESRAREAELSKRHSELHLGVPRTCECA